MHRIDTSTAQKDKFGAGKNGFTRGNPQTGTPATELDDDYFDSIQEEIAGVIEAAGLSLAKANNAQLVAAIKALTGPGRLLNVQVFTASGTYTPTSGTKRIKVRMVGGGGAGGGTAVTSATQIAAAFGGNAGSYAESKIIDVSAVASVVVTVGSAGLGMAGATGGNGGASTFGSYLIAPGGAGGPLGPAGSGLSMASDSAAGTASSGSALLFGDSGRPGSGPISISTDVGSQSNFKSGKGADSVFGGSGGGKIGGGTVRAANGYGAGGGGQAVGPSATTTGAGGNGSGGLVIVEEYA
ncbi:hypothetical protein H8V75_03465 [Enterobacter roggenkampii]|uniref:glycine-rich domain-containing protein n=1 Tax=Enterobacter roggenkampii TaxID=1812935 RepID=UPI001E52A8D4|nr:hypothetical protein [Enterobacter roggenkampii]MCC7577994.1 hypothetical protein [Enterobacter roggenkampii]MCC7586860.1 hypothetical protein [Enterobacter roggenkampii]MCC7591918.1 hypothetical protein [Enterobacter roggenkampii]MCC7601488.1 hypothetical protein [Enterobacter roggenkampii]MCC7606088.1 hypothetical protein [Enterobacter roggenkampii]